VEPIDQRRRGQGYPGQREMSALRCLPIGWAMATPGEVRSARPLAKLQQRLEPGWRADPPRVCSRCATAKYDCHGIGDASAVTQRVTLP